MLSTLQNLARSFCQPLDHGKILKSWSVTGKKCLSCSASPRPSHAMSFLGHIQAGLSIVQRRVRSFSLPARDGGGASGIYCLWTRSHSLLRRPGERWCPSAPGPPPRSPSCSRAVPGLDPPDGPPGLAACLRWRRWAVGTRLSRRTRMLVARGTQTRGLQAPGKQEETRCGCSAPSIILPWQL